MGLDRCEDVTPIDRALPRNKSFAKLWIVKDSAIDFLALLQDLVPMSDEQQALESGLAQSLVVECRHPRLACAGRGNHKVAVVATTSFRRSSASSISSWNGFGAT